MAVDRRRFLRNGLLAGSSVITSPWVFSTGARAAGEVKVGVLFSLTGGLSIIEKSLHDATMMAISEINACRRRQGDEDRGDRRRRRVRSEDLQREGFQARHPGSRADGVRILHLREPQGGAAGVRKAQQSLLLSDLLRRLRVLEERRLYRRGSEPAAFELHSLDHQDARQEEVLHRRIELHLSARDGEGLEDPDREERRRMDRRRIPRTRPLRMGLDGQQDQGLRLRRGAVERGRRFRRRVLSRIQEPGPDPRQAADLRDGDLGNRDRGDGRRNMRSAASPRSRTSRPSTPTATRPSSSAIAPSSRTRRP